MRKSIDRSGSPQVVILRLQSFAMFEKASRCVVWVSCATCSNALKLKQFSDQGSVVQAESLIIARSTYRQWTSLYQCATDVVPPSSFPS